MTWNIKYGRCKVYNDFIEKKLYFPPQIQFQSTWIRGSSYIKRTCIELERQSIRTEHPPPLVKRLTTALVKEVYYQRDRIGNLYVIIYEIQFKKKTTHNNKHIFKKLYKLVYYTRFFEKMNYI
jgi:hypothetical protein